jgi:integrase
MGRGTMTMADAIAELKADLESQVEKLQKKPKAQEYRLQRLNALLKSWQGFEKLDAGKITKRDCEEWGRRFVASSCAYNNTVGTLRMLFDIAIAHDARTDNPAKGIKKVRVRTTREKNIPSRDEFNALLKEVRKVKVGRVRMCADLIRFLAFSGMRKSEAARVLWEDCDFEKEKITVKGDPETGTKNWDTRTIPMIGEMRNLLEEMRGGRPDAKPTDRVTEVKECQGVLNRACKAAGVRRLTHHTLRDLFATVCIENGTDIPTVAHWLGHKDGGVLLMKTYNHLRDEHSKLMAKKVSFGTKPITLGAVPPKEPVNVSTGNEDAAKSFVSTQQAPVDQAANSLLASP